MQFLTVVYICSPRLVLSKITRICESRMRANLTASAHCMPLPQPNNQRPLKTRLYKMLLFFRSSNQNVKIRACLMVLKAWISKGFCRGCWGLNKSRLSNWALILYHMAFEFLFLNKTLIGWPHSNMEGQLDTVSQAQWFTNASAALFKITSSVAKLEFQ